MSDRKISFALVGIPRELRFAYGYVESKPIKAKRLTGNRLWQSVPADMRKALAAETRKRLESDLDRARQAGDWGKVNRLAALLSRLTLAG